MAEGFGVETRGSFYETVGTILDVVQNTCCSWHPGNSERSGEQRHRVNYPTNHMIRRRLLSAVVLATATVTMLLAVPPLRRVAHRIGTMSPVWVVVAVALEVGSCVGYVVIFRRFFDRVPPAPARELAWTEEASGALLPTGGVGALAIGGLLLRQSGMSTRQIVERSSALFFFTSAANVAALVGGGALLATGAAGGTDTVALAGVPILIGAVATGVTLALAAIVRRRPGRRWPTWLVDMAAGIDGAVHALLHPSWRLLGAVAYLGFDIAALGAAFAAAGHAIPVDVLVLGYVIGYIADMVPVPGGFGILEAGLAGTLILYGAPGTQAAAAVVVYHAIAFWVPSLGGLIGYARLRRGPTREVTVPSTEAAALSPTPARAAG
jgi:uncharacterized membrane protein YbhN (UPF0104 family)